MQSSSLSKDSIKPLFELRPEGLYCPLGSFYVDAWKPVDLNLVTHGHSDHARWGSKQYIASFNTLPLLNERIPGHSFKGVPWNEKFKLGSVWVSFHPAGHILGSAQIRVEHNDRVWVFTGDFKRAYDPSCEPFELVECDTLIMESTFALPIYHWRFNPQEIIDWWEKNKKEKQTSILCCYVLGKAQRILASISTDEPIYLHGACLPYIPIYEKAGYKLAPTKPVSELPPSETAGKLILAPPSASGSSWMKRFPNSKLALASGWMQVRGAQRRQGYDKGFVLSDHADWDDLIRTVHESKASHVIATHGFSDVFARYLNEEGIKASKLITQFEVSDEILS